MSLAIAPEHPDQSSVQPTPGLPESLDSDQHRRMTVPDKNGKCLVPSLCKVVGPVPVRERFGVNIPHRWWKRRCRTSQTYRERTVIWTMNAAV